MSLHYISFYIITLPSKLTEELEILDDVRVIGRGGLLVIRSSPPISSPENETMSTVDLDKEMVDLNLVVICRIFKFAGSFA